MTWADPWLPLMALLQKQANQGFSEGVAIIIAGVGGAILAAVLQTLGAFLINYLAAQREDRAATREAARRHEQWEREDKLRQEDQAEEAKRRNRAERAQAYRRFAAATAVPMSPYNIERQASLLADLAETHTEVQAYGTQDLRTRAQDLYDDAYGALYAEDDNDSFRARQSLESSREEFWNAIKREE